MTDLKTKQTDNDVEHFINSITDDLRREDCTKVLKIMKEATGEVPKLWGSNMVGFGQYHYKYDSGREGDWFITGFSPRKQHTSIYLMYGFDQYKDLISNLGKFKQGKACLNIKRLSDVNIEVLKQLIKRSYKYVNQKYNNS